MRIGSLFSGAGGLDLAVAQVFGGDVVWHAEIDKAASKVLAYRFPGVPNLGSVTDIDWATVPPVDVLCGGFPCQDVSAAGKRAGIKDGTRSGLWSVFAEAIDQLRPQYVVVENVRGLLSATAHRDMESDEADMGVGGRVPVLRAAGAVLGDLADLGYDAQWATVAAADVGAPHRRERVFILANTESARRCVRDAANFGAAYREVNAFADDCGPAADSSRNGWDEGRPEPARLVGGFDVAVSGDEPGVALLPTPTQSDGTGGGIRTGLSWEGTTKSTGDGGNSRLRDVAGLLGPLLPTPNAQDGNVGGRYSSAGHQSTLPGEVRLLPTPQARDFKGTDSPADHNRRSPGMDAVTYHFLPTPEAKNSHAGPDYARMNREGSGGHDLVTALTLLCTPSASDGAGGKTSRSGDRINEPLLGGQAREMSTVWGKYEPAIRRWEAIVGPAPAPTEPNKNGNPRLSAAFSEWLMGWPAGWVTDPAIGISRNDQLRIVGNGVCPQQAMAALRFLLNVAVAA